MGYMVLPSLRHPAWGIDFHQNFNLSSHVPFPPYTTSLCTLFLLVTVEGTAPDFEWCLGGGGRCVMVKATFAAWTLCPISCSKPDGFVLQAKSGPWAINRSIGIYHSYHCKWIQRKVWEPCIKGNSFLFCTSILYLKSFNYFSWIWKQFKAKEYISSSSLLPLWQNMYQIEKVQPTTCQESSSLLSNKSL